MKRRLYIVTNSTTSKSYDKWGKAYRVSNGIKGTRVESCGSVREANRKVKSNIRHIALKNSDSKVSIVELTITDQDVVAFTDGAYSNSNFIQYRVVGIGIVYFSIDGLKEIRYGITNHEQSILRNIFAEVEAVRCAISLAVREKRKSITICHDYNGIAMWAENKWKAKCPFTRGYVTFIKEMSRLISIRFVNVKGHAKVKYNELANLLAEVALIEETERTIKWYKANKVPKEELKETSLHKDKKEHSLGSLTKKLKELKEFQR